MIAPNKSEFGTEFLENGWSNEHLEAGEVGGGGWEGGEAWEGERGERGEGGGGGEKGENVPKGWRKVSVLSV